MAYANHVLRPDDPAGSRDRPRVAPELAVEALRVAARALDPRPRLLEPKEQALDVIEARLDAILQSLGAQVDAIESIRAHLRLLEPARERGESARGDVPLPPHWRSRGPKPRLDHSPLRSK